MGEPRTRLPPDAGSASSTPIRHLPKAPPRGKRSESLEEPAGLGSRVMALGLRRRLCRPFGTAHRAPRRSRPPPLPGRLLTDPLSIVPFNEKGSPRSPLPLRRLPGRAGRRAGQQLGVRLEMPVPVAPGWGPPGLVLTDGLSAVEFCVGDGSRTFQSFTHSPRGRNGPSGMKLPQNCPQAQCSAWPQLSANRGRVNWRRKSDGKRAASSSRFQK